MEIRQVQEEDEKGIRELFYLCFGRQFTHSEWVWEYKGSPWGSTAVVTTIDDDTIVAHYGGVKIIFHSPGHGFDVYQPCDVMTHPKYRARFFAKRGALVRAGELFYEVNSMDFAFGFPSERHAILGTKQLGYTEHSYITVLSKKVLSFIDIQNPLLKVEIGWDFITGVELDALWDEVRDSYTLSIEKNSDYIFWRYRDNPVKQYEPLIVRARYKKAIKAFAIFSFVKHDLIILDFFCIRGIKIRFLFKLFEKIAIKHGLDNVKLWVNPNENIFQSRVEYGYVPEKGIPYIFKIMNKEIDPLFLFEKYCYRMGDYDAS